MILIADTHTHTIACDHAYSTIDMNAKAAAERGIKFLAVTEHAPALPGAPGEAFFWNLPILPRTIKGVTILKGAEVNILDDKGKVDLPESRLKELDWVIASFHVPTFAPQTEKEHTKAWLAIANNPLIDVIGHCGDERYRFDMETVVKEFAKTGKIVEVNGNSFNSRPGSRTICPQIVQLCKKHKVQIVVNSDAHYSTRVGHWQESLQMLEDNNFPQELIINADYDRFYKIAQSKAYELLPI